MLGYKNNVLVKNKTLNNRIRLIGEITKELKLAHKDIETGEVKCFIDSLSKFSFEILESIVLKRLKELTMNPNLKR